MKFVINRKRMLEAAKTAAKVAPKNSPVEVLNGIFVECNENTGNVFLTATSFDVSIQLKTSGTVEASGEFLINAKMLVEMLNLFENETVTFSAERPERLKISTGRSKYILNCLSPKSYPKPVMPYPEDSVSMRGICSLAKRTVFAVGKDENKLAFQCVNVSIKDNAVHAVASDGGMRMMLIKDSAGPAVEQSFMLPGKSLDLLASTSSDTDVFEVGDIGKEVVFVRGDMIFSIRKMNTGAYIDTNTLIQKLKPIYSAVVNVSKFEEALEIMAVSALAGGSRAPVNMAFSKNEIVLCCNSDYSIGNTSVAAKINEPTPEKGFYYDISALLKLLDVVSGKIIVEMDARGFMLIKTKSEVYMQAPTRQPAKKVVPTSEPKKEKARAKGAREMKEVA